MASGDGSQIYEDLMRLKPQELTPNAWAVKAGVSRTVWADMRRHGNPSRRTLEKLLTAAGSSLAEFEALRIGPGSDVGAARGLADRGALPWAGQALPPLPLVATALAGEWGEGAPKVELTELRSGQIVDRLPRPPSLANDPRAYAITVVGDSMWPRFRPGRRVAVSPGAPVAMGDDVLVKLSGGGDPKTIRVLIKELVRKTASGVELRQFNPDATFEVAAGDIDGIERIAGELF